MYSLVVGTILQALSHQSSIVDFSIRPPPPIAYHHHHCNTLFRLQPSFIRLLSWETYSVWFKLINPLWQLRRLLGSLMMFLSRVVIVFLGFSEAGLLDISLSGFSSWMSSVRPKQRLLNRLKASVCRAKGYREMDNHIPKEEDNDINWDTEDELEIQNIVPSSYSTLVTRNSEAIISNEEASSSAGYSNSNLIQHFLGMGFPENLVLKAIKEDGDTESILETLLTLTALDNSPEEQSSCDLNSHQQQQCVNNDELSSDYDEGLFEDFSESDSWSDDEITEVENFIEPSNKEALNTDGKTPRMVFTDEHEMLLEKGQEWMKDTASSCTVVAALIVTMAFAAVFTVPGGNQDDGKPLFQNRNTFMFIVSDAVALFSSSTSVLMFLGILTSRFGESDFLYSLPKRLTIGLVMLFMSLAATLIAFSSVLALVLEGKVTWIAAPLVIATSIPVCLFGLLQFPLLVELVNSTYGKSIFHQQNHRRIY